MKKLILIFAWYFYFQHPLPGGPDGSMVNGRVGGFASESVCKIFAEALGSVDFPGLKITKCVDERDS